MKKRLLCTILILVMAFGATAPVYAEAWTSTQATNVTNDVNDIELHTQNIYQYLRDFLLSYNSGQTSDWTFGDLYWEIKRIGSWVAPVGSNDGSYETLWSTLLNIAIDTRSYLPHIPTIASYVSNWMTTNSNYLNDLDMSITNYFRDASSVNIANRKLNTHTALVNSALQYSLYSWVSPTSNSGYSTTNFNWKDGSPFGNIALILQKLNNNYVIGTYNSYLDLFSGANTSTVLSVWDSQLDSLTQETWSPTSGFNGLYKYLAYLQRDVARMTFIIADPHEQAAMENANESGVADMYADVYDSDNGGVTLSDMSDTFNTQKVAKQTFDTGVSFSTNGLFSFTDDGNWGFWSTAVKNDMDNVPMTRKSESYDSTAYDTQLEELYSIWGIKDGK